MRHNVKAKWFSIVLGMINIATRYGVLSNKDADESMTKAAQALLWMREISDNTKDREYVAKRLAKIVKGTYAEHGWLCMEVNGLFIVASPLEIRMSLGETLLSITSYDVTWHYRNGEPKVFARLWEYARVAQWVSKYDIVTAPYRDEVEEILRKERIDEDGE
jgi:hypothetical protein